MSNQIKLTALLLLFSSPLFAQQEIGLQFMRHLWQANETNPAIVPDHLLVIGAPGFRTNLVFTGATYNQIVREENGKNVIDIDRMIENLDPQNVVRGDLEIETVSAVFQMKGLTLSLGHSLKYHAFFDFPKTLPELIWQGNAQFIGDTVNLANELQVNGYHELALGAAYQFFDILTLGAKAKFLSGIADATTDPAHRTAQFYTDPDVYQITLIGDYVLNSSNSIDYNDFQDVDANFNFGQFTFDRFFSNNQGLAFDLGARLELGKLDLAASVLDLGKITWDEGVKNYSALKTVTYDGLDFSQAVTGGETADFDSALDTLKELFEVVETQASYSTDLPRKIYASALYDLTEKWSVGASLFSENFRGENFTAVAVGANGNLSKFIRFGATYGYKDERWDNLGLNLTLRLGPVQLFALTDNVFSLVNSGDSRNFHGRIGGNLVFK